MGGAGNRLFQLARALDLKSAGLNPVVVEIEDVPELYELAGRFLGWTRHPDWLDTRALTARLGLQSRRVTLTERLSLYIELVRSRLSSGRHRFNLPLKADLRSAQIGYFQANGCISPESVAALSNALSEHLPLASHPRHNAVVHIRGGDFAAEDRLSLESIAEFQVAAPDAVCVTNDPKYVRANFPGLAFAPSKGPKDDFMTIARTHLVMPSNSTFCFWGCVIAVRAYDAKLWRLPPDDYWKQLAPQELLNA